MKINVQRLVLVSLLLLLCSSVSFFLSSSLYMDTNLTKQVEYEEEEEFMSLIKKLRDSLPSQSSEASAVDTQIHKLIRHRERVVGTRV